MDTILGIDVGGTGIKGALVDVTTGKLLTERHKIRTPQPADPAAVLATTKELISLFNWEGKDIGIGFPCIVKNGFCLSANNISKEWIGINLVDHFSKGTNSNVSILNDADAAAVAESQFGQGKNLKGLMILITIGTGIGSGFVYNGTLLPNVELGSIKWKEKEVEKYVSNKTRNKKNLTWKEWGSELGKFLNHVVRIYSPDLIVLGGGVSKNFELYEAYLKMKQDVPIKTASYLNAAGVIGAALYHKQNI